MTGINTKLKATVFFEKCFEGTITQEDFDCDSTEELKGKVREKLKNLITIGDFFDKDFNHLPFRNGHPNSVKPIKKPQNFEKMLEIGKKLSQGIPHVRVDLYDVNGKIYFGELTFFHWSGMVPFEPEEWDYKFGEWIKLPEKNA